MTKGKKRAETKKIVIRAVAILIAVIMALGTFSMVIATLF